MWWEVFSSFLFHSIFLLSWKAALHNTVQVQQGWAVRSSSPPTSCTQCLYLLVREAEARIAKQRNSVAQALNSWYRCCPPEPAPMKWPLNIFPLSLTDWPTDRPTDGAPLRLKNKPHIHDGNEHLSTYIRVFYLSVCPSARAEKQTICSVIGFVLFFLA